MQNFKEIGPAVCSGDYPDMKNGGASYNMSQPVYNLLSVADIIVYSKIIPESKKKKQPE